MKRKLLSKSEIRELNNKISSFKIEFDKKDKIEIINDDLIYYVKDGQVIFFEWNNKIIPSLKLDVNLPVVEIDLPAVKFISSGADIMRPGIVHFDEFENGEIVLIRDEKHKKKIAIGISNDNSKNLKESSTGKSIKNIHYVTDKIWNFKI